MKRMVILLVFAVFAALPICAEKYASINAKEVNVRSCAGASCAVKFHMWRYTPVLMIKANEDKSWVLIKDFEGYNGWVSANLLSANGGMSAKVDLNVRQSPSASADIVCTVERGYPFKYLSRKGKWIQVVDEPENASEGKCQGWVYSANLWGFFKQ